MKKLLSCVLALALVLSMLPVLVLTASAEAPEKIVYTRWDEDPLTEEQWAQIEKDLNIDVEVMVVPYNDYYAKINTLISAGEAPDVMQISEFLAVEWGEKGMTADLVPLFEKMGTNMRSTYVAATLYGSEGKVYGITPGLTCIMLFYNKDLYDQYGVAYPSSDPANPVSWADYVKNAQLLTRDSAGKSPLDEGFNADDIVTYGTKTTSWSFSYTALLFSNKTAIFSEDGMSLAFESPEAQEVMTELTKLSSEYKCAPDAIIGESLPGNVQMFKDGMLANCIEGSFMIASYVKEGANFGIAPLPMFQQPATAAWSAAHAVSATSKHQEAAARLVKYLADTQNGSQYPGLKASYEKEPFDAWLNGLGLKPEDVSWMADYINSDAAKIHEAVYIKNYGTILDEAVNPTADKLWAGEITVDEFAAETAELAKDLFQGKYMIIAE